MVERATGQGLEQYMRENIFDPVGATSMTFYPTKEVLGRLMKPCSMDQATGELKGIDGPPIGKPLTVDEIKVPMPYVSDYRWDSLTTDAIAAEGASLVPLETISKSFRGYCDLLPRTIPRHQNPYFPRHRSRPSLSLYFRRRKAQPPLPG